MKGFIPMSQDLRRYAKQTNVRIFAGFLFILALVGDGLIYWIYGKQAAVLGLMCMGLGLLPLLLIWLILLGLEWWAKREES
jgi:hypothetical protein